MRIPILRVRDENGNVYAIPAIQGAAGENGITPTIGSNGNWYLGSTDTGKPSRGAQGIQGDQGIQGEPGDDAPTITNITIRQSDYHMIVTLSDGTIYDAGYCRGAPGAGTGDMLASTYDPQGKAQDIFAYIDNAVSGITAADVTFSDGETFQQKYDSGELKGKDGVGIQKVEQTTISNEDGGTNVITVTKTDGSSSTFSVKNGNKGSAGHTPVKGTDYFTEADKNELVNLVLANFTNVSEVGM